MRRRERAVAGFLALVVASQKFAGSRFNEAVNEAEIRKTPNSAKQGPPTDRKSLVKYAD